MPHHTLFISDLHLSPDYPAITQLFLEFLKNQAPSADALYILGDLFEVWVGDDNQTEFNQMIQAKIKELAQTGKPIYFMRGNRDFLIGKKFAEHAGCKLLADMTVINLYGTRALLMHGDALCTEDIKHQKFRRFSESRLARFIFLSSPLKVRQRIANKIRTNSMQRGSELTTQMLDVVQVDVEKVMREYKVPNLIHGHTHKANIHEFTLDNAPVKRIVLGDWYKYGSALKWNQDGSCQLLSIPD